MLISLLVATTAFTLRTPPPRMCELPATTERPSPMDKTSVRTFDKAEEKALRKVRLDFGGYPAGKYYTLEQESGAEAACAQVRTDFPVLNAWSNDEILATYQDLSSTPAEIFIYSPLGPFFVLSAISIWRDGLSAWGIPPCKDYIGACQDLADATSAMFSGPGFTG